MYDRTVYLNEGMVAGLDGLPEDACPYPPKSRERALWIEGWHCAADD
jgi:ribosome modulation factor